MSPLDDFITQLLSTTVRHVDIAEALSNGVMMVLPLFPMQWAPTQVHHNAVHGHHTALQRTKTQEYALTRLEHAKCTSQPFLVSTVYKTPLHIITWIQQHSIHLEDQTSHVPFTLSWPDFIRIPLHTLPMVSLLSYIVTFAKFSFFCEILYAVCSPLDLHYVWCNP